MTGKIFALSCDPGIQRDGTDLASKAWQEGLWVRFQRGLPRNIGGYTQLLDPIPTGGEHARFNSKLTYLPRQCFALPSLINRNQWNVIVGSRPPTSGDQYTDLVQNYIIDADTGYLVDQYPFTELNVIAANNEAVTWQFESIAVGNNKLSGGGNITLFVLQTDTMGSISSLNIAHKVYYINAQTMSSGNAELQPLSLTKGLVPALTDDDSVWVGGGIVSLYPYVFFYNYATFTPVTNDIPPIAVGSVAQSYGALIPDGTPNKSIIQNIVQIASTNIVYGAAVRGSGNSPAGLFWSLDTLTRCYFTGGATTFAFDTIAANLSIMSSRCVVEDNGLFYWIGLDRFYVYNGTVQTLANNTNINYFFSNIDTAQRQKVWGCKVSQFNEIWWHYPNATIDGYNNECNAVLIYNIQEQTWYDSAFPKTTLTPAVDPEDPTKIPSVGRSCGTSATNFLYPIWLDSSQSYLNDAGTAIDPAYRIWLHENTPDQTIPGDTVPYQKARKEYAIPTYLESSLMSLADIGPDKQPIGEDKWLSLTRMEPDFVFNGDIDFYIKTKKYSGDYFPPDNQCNVFNKFQPYVANSNDPQAICLLQNLIPVNGQQNLIINGNLSLAGASSFSTSRQPLMVFYDRLSIGIEFLITGIFNGVLQSETITGTGATGQSALEYLNPGIVPTKYAYDSITSITYTGSSSVPADHGTVGLVTVGVRNPPAGLPGVNEIQRLTNFHIDMREQGRFMTIKFLQNTIGGNFQLGRTLLHFSSGSGRQ
jgi:hypothetical protein